MSNGVGRHQHQQPEPPVISARVSSATYDRFAYRIPQVFGATARASSGGKTKSNGNSTRSSGSANTARPMHPSPDAIPPIQQQERPSAYRAASGQRRQTQKPPSGNHRSTPTALTAEPSGVNMPKVDRAHGHHVPTNQFDEDDPAINLAGLGISGIYTESVAQAGAVLPAHTSSATQSPGVTDEKLDWADSMGSAPALHGGGNSTAARAYNSPSLMRAITAAREAITDHEALGIPFLPDERTAMRALAHAIETLGGVRRHPAESPAHRHGSSGSAQAPWTVQQPMPPVTMPGANGNSVSMRDGEASDVDHMVDLNNVMHSISSMTSTADAPYAPLFALSQVTRRFFEPCRATFFIVDNGGAVQQVEDAECVALDDSVNFSDKQLQAVKSVVLNQSAMTTNSGVIIPLIRQSRPVGAVSFSTLDSRPVALHVDGQTVTPTLINPSSPDHTVYLSANLVDTLTNFAAMLIQNIATTGEADQRQRAVNAMTSLAMHIANNMYDEKSLVGQVLDTVRVSCEGDRASFFTVTRHADDGKVDMEFTTPDGGTSQAPRRGCIAAQVAETGVSVHINDAARCAKANKHYDSLVGHTTQSILCAPVRVDDSTVAVVQLVNKRPGMLRGDAYRRGFSKRDDELFRALVSLVGVSLRKCRQQQLLSEDRKNNSKLLKAVRAISTADVTDAAAVRTAVEAAVKNMFPSAEDVCTFVVDQSSQTMARWQRGAETLDINNSIALNATSIATTVARTGEGVRVDSLPDHTLFRAKIDAPSTISPTTLVSEPVALLDGTVVAVISVINLTDPVSGVVKRFGRRDENLIKLICVYAAALMRLTSNTGTTLLDMQLYDNELAKRRARELDTVCARIQAISDGNVLLKNIEGLDFDIFKIMESETAAPLDLAAKIVTSLIYSTGLPQQFGCTLKTLQRFVVACRSRYRNVPYHSFFHVVDVVQTVHTFLFRAGGAQMLEGIERFALLIAALVHDIDHPGVNNSFHLKAKTAIGILASIVGQTSVLEAHHAALAIDILRTPGTDIFGAMGEEEQAAAFGIVAKTVLHTDPVHHGRCIDGLKKIGGGAYNRDNEEHRVALIDGIMHGADVSNPIKPFPIALQWAERVVEEFSQQGDKERARGDDVLPMFDRDQNRNLPKGQVGFIMFVTPLFVALDDALPNFGWGVAQMRSNQQEWMRIAEDQ
jgi:cAMP-specific phosphodiesterase